MAKRTQKTVTMKLNKNGTMTLSSTGGVDLRKIIPSPQPHVMGPADQIIAQIEGLFPDWPSYRDLVDCIECTLYRLMKERDELRAGIKRLSDEEELCAETTGDDPFSMVHLAAKLAAADAAQAEEWRLRGKAEASRDAARDAASSLLQDRKALIEAIQPLLRGAYYARENDLSGHETLIVTASEAREAATVVERISAEEDDQS